MPRFLPPQPTVPAALAFPLRLIPNRLHSFALTKVINLLLATPQHAGDFGFLRDKVLSIVVLDAKIAYRFGLFGEATHFTSCPMTQPPDLTISGTAYDFLALATRREDADTLFFQQRVVMEGDTALGLELKNWLDATELASFSGPLPHLLRAMQGAMAFYEDHLAKPAAAQQVVG